jgi:hypothetical protein
MQVRSRGTLFTLCQRWFADGVTRQPALGAGGGHTEPTPGMVRASWDGAKPRFFVPPGLKELLNRAESRPREEHPALAWRCRRRVCYTRRGLSCHKPEAPAPGRPLAGAASLYHFRPRRVQP